MSLSALDSLDDAIDATQRFLLPFDRVRWFRMAVVMLFVAAGGGLTFNFPFAPGGTPVGDGGTGQPGQPGQPDPAQLTPELTPVLLAFIVLFVAFVVAVGIAWGILSATMEFVFVESLDSEAVELRKYARRYWRKGVRLFAFRLGVWLLAVGGAVLAVLAVGVALGGWPPTQWTDGAIVAAIFLGVPLFLVAFVVVGILLGFTTVFVVPVMLTEDRGVLSAWRRFLSTLGANPVEYLVYLVLSVVLGFVVGLAVSLVLLAVLIVVGLVALVVAIPGIALFLAGLQGLGGALLLVVGFAALLVVFVAGLLVQVPFQTFLRYYALLVLGDTDADLDVIPTTRAAVRADGGEREGAADDSDENDGDGDAAVDEDGASEDFGEGDAGDGPNDSGDDDDDGWDVDR